MDLWVGHCEAGDVTGDQLTQNLPVVTDQGQRGGQLLQEARVFFASVTLKLGGIATQNDTLAAGAIFLSATRCYHARLIAAAQYRCLVV